MRTVICSIVFALLGLVLAAALSNFIGPGVGRLAGKLEGSVEGTQDGAQEGKQEGLSAKDTEVDIAGKVEAAGNLEVLSADVVLTNKNEVGDDYERLQAYYGDLVFTVDLSQAEITHSDSDYQVTIPPVQPKITIDNERTQTLATDMKHSWSGSNEDGYTEAANSFAQLCEKMEDTVSNYEALVTAAENSAEKQVELLVSSASMDEEVSVDVQFRESEGEGTEGEDSEG